MKTALTIAGSDPSGGAGVQSDLKVFGALGVYGLSVISALTAQNSGGVKAVHPVPADFLRKQMSVLLADTRPDALKTGMLYSEANVECAADLIKQRKLSNVVIDPVLLSTSGKRLARKGLAGALRKRLLPLCSVVTPNMYEASVLASIEVEDLEDMKEAAVRLFDMGAKSVVVTGGHLEDVAVDVMYDGKFRLLRGKKIRGEFHGTGCRFSAAITALLANGLSVADAVDGAKGFMRKSLLQTFAVTDDGMRLFI